MRLLFITEFFDHSKQTFTGGVEARTHFTVQYLKQKHQVKVVARSKRAVSASAWSIFSRALFQLTSLLRSLFSGADLIEGSNFVCYLPAFVAAKLTRAKAVAWYADVYQKTWFATMSWPVAITGYLMEAISLKLPWDRVIAMSEATKEKLIQSGVPGKKITVVYGGVDTHAIKLLHPQPSYEIPTICTAARLVAYKRIDDLIQAFDLVRKKLPTAQLMIMGDGPDAARLKKLSTKLELNNCVHYMGTLSHQKVLELMKRSHVFSLPSAVEGFGLVSIEAAACGLPYVSSDIPATLEITQDGKGGFLYSVGDYQELADKLILLLTDADTYVTKRRQAKQLAQDYDWQQILKKTEKVYQSILEE